MDVHDLGRPRTFQIAAGTVGVALCAVVAIGWALGEPALVQIRPDWVAMVLNTAVCFVLLGAGLVLPDRVLRVRLLLGSVVSVLGAANLAESLSGIDLHIDWRTVHAWLDDGNHWPGRMAPNTALGFLLAGAVLSSMGYVKRRAYCVSLQVATFVVLLLGLTGLVGYTLQLELMYSWFQATRMAVHTAVGMSVVGLGLWSSWLRSDWYQDQRLFREDERITFVGAALLVIVALTTGVAGFATHQKTLDRILSESLPLSLKNRTDHFQQRRDHVGRGTAHCRRGLLRRQGKGTQSGPRLLLGRHRVCRDYEFA